MARMVRRTNGNEMTQLTLEEALQQGIAHHQAGRLGEAEQLYRAILKVVPDHPDANHNLGVIATQTGNPASALPHFKAALEANPGDGQYWLSYAEALFQSGMADEARRILAEGRNKGLHGPSVDELEQRLSGAQANPGMNTLLAHFSQGRLAEAETAARSILSKSPREIMAWKVLGVVLSQTRRTVEAHEALQRAVELSPRDAEAHNVLGIVLKDLRRPEEAETSYRKAIEIRPDYAEAHCNLGALLGELGKLPEAEASYRKAISINPDFSGAHGNLGLTLQSLGRLEEAENSILRAIGINPNDPAAHFNLGNIQKEMGRLPAAEASFRRALELDPSYAEAFCNFGNVLKDLGKSSEAEKSYRRAIEIKPDFAWAYCNLGISLLDRGHFEESESCCRTAIKLRPEFAAFHYNLANALMSRGKSADAEMSFRKAIEIQPEYVESYNNLSIVLRDLGRLEESAAASMHALRIKPDYAEALGNLGISLCLKGEMKRGIDAIGKAIEIDPRLEHMHSSLIFYMDLHPGFDTGALQAERRKWAERHASPLFQARQFMNVPDPERKLRLGYVSGDFNNHSAANGFASLLGNFDRTHFEVYAYSNSDKADAVTESLRRDVTAWRNIYGMSDQAAADQIMQDNIDILVDLSGFTQGNRLLVFARKPAPIQVSMMGYPTGTGMIAMDAILVDKVVVPPEEKQLYAEEIRYLPCVVDYSSPKEFPEINELPALSGKDITFGSFNRLVKISDDVFALWKEILSNLPGSRLILKTGEIDGKAVSNRVLRHFEGMENRITILGKTSWLEHVRAYNLVDISLDPFPHGGGVTTIESIRIGVPVLTLKYPTFAGRASASILTTLGLTDWIAESPEAYVGMAVEKSGDLARLAELRGKLRGIYAASILGDRDYYLRTAEKQYRALWREWCARQKS